ncbi:MAG: hypothetical protein OJF51_005039 [Nitrospira sp.]|jgi:hypothetical protein|nr:MAG: hypothetical protein OJF51_005039 [Nitrospira sp.]
MVLLPSLPFHSPLFVSFASGSVIEACVCWTAAPTKRHRGTARILRLLLIRIQRAHPPPVLLWFKVPSRVVCWKTCASISDWIQSNLEELEELSRFPALPHIILRHATVSAEYRNPTELIQAPVLRRVKSYPGTDRCVICKSYPPSLHGAGPKEGADGGKWHGATIEA